MSAIAKTVRPVLTETAEEGVFDANFSEIGLANVAAVVFCGPEVGGLKTFVNDQLSPAAHWDAVNVVLERLVASPMPRRFALIKTSELPRREAGERADVFGEVLSAVEGAGS